MCDKTDEKKKTKEKAERFEEITKSSAKTGATMVTNLLKDKGLDASKYKDEIEETISAILHGNLFMTSLLLSL